MGSTRNRRKVGVWMRVKDGSAIRRRRDRMRYSQRELALLVKCSQNTIHLLESGKMLTLSDTLALRIAKRLDVDVEDFFEERVSVVMPRVTTGQRDTRNRGAVA